MSDIETRRTAYDEAVTELAEEYSQKLQDIYDRRTAGDFTFLGVLGEYTMKLDALRAKRPQNGMVFGGPFATNKPLPPYDRPGGPGEAAMARQVVSQRERRRYFS